MIEFLPTPWHWLGAVGCALVVGAAKTGIPGLGFLAVPWLALLFHDQVRMSAGALLPLLCVADVMAVWLYRNNRAIHQLWHMLPWVLAGMGLGAAALWLLSDAVLRPVLGVILLGMIGLHLWRKRHADLAPLGRGAAAAFGVTAGTTTTIANAAGPVMNIYLLSQRLPKEDFIAAGAWFFFAVNLAKLPIYGSRGMITVDTLLIDAWLVPAVIAGSLIGRRIVKRIPQGTFELIVLLLATIGSLMLFIPTRPA
ncbi:MAG TPA: hypothetical protein DCS97_02665 [Planctomycetes bacterium]|nr:hypothetical protein [Planctomycetota bacterium]